MLIAPFLRRLAHFSCAARLFKAFAIAGMIASAAVAANRAAVWLRAASRRRSFSIAHWY
jgi:hypothetical protein